MRFVVLLAVGSLFFACGEKENQATGKVSIHLENGTGMNLTGEEALTAFQFKLTSLFTHSGYSGGGLIDSKFIWQRQCDGGDDCYFDMIDPKAVNEHVETNLLPITVWEGEGDVPGDASYSFKFIGFGYDCGGGQNNLKWGTVSIATRETKMEDCGIDSEEMEVPMVLKEGESITVTLVYDLANSVVPDVGDPSTFGQKRLDCQNNPNEENQNKENAICFKFPKLDATAVKK